MSPRGEPRAGSPESAASVITRRKAHGGDAGTVGGGDLVEGDAAGEVHVRPSGGAGPPPGHPVREPGGGRSEEFLEGGITVVLVADVDQRQWALLGCESRRVRLVEVVTHTARRRSSPSTRHHSRRSAPPV
jgi:hypothetical protein